MNENPLLSDALKSLDTLSNNISSLDNQSTDDQSTDISIDNKDSNKEDESNNISWIINIIIYIGLGLIFLKIFKSEKLDLFCPKEVKQQCDKCGDGFGKYYVDGKSSKKDNIDILLNKINILADTQINTVKWRRCLMLSIISALLIGVIVYGKIFDGNKMVKITLCIFMVYYGSFSYYNYHYDKYQSQYIKENIEIIKNIIIEQKNLEKKNK